MTGSAPSFPLYDHCLNFTLSLINNPLSDSFRKQYVPLIATDYFNIIKNPMDLNTVRERLLNLHYMHYSQWSTDVKLIFDNAILYNGETHLLGSLARYFLQKLSKFECNLELLNARNYEERIRKLNNSIFEHIKTMPMPNSTDSENQIQSEVGNSNSPEITYIFPFADFSYERIDFNKTRIRNIRNSLNQLSDLGKFDEIIQVIHDSNPQYKNSPSTIDVAALGKNTLIDLENFIAQNQELTINGTNSTDQFNNVDQQLTFISNETTFQPLLEPNQSDSSVEITPVVSILEPITAHHVTENHPKQPSESTISQSSAEIHHTLSIFDPITPQLVSENSSAQPFLESEIAEPFVETHHTSSIFDPITPQLVSESITPALIDELNAQVATDNIKNLSITQQTDEHNDTEK